MVSLVPESYAVCTLCCYRCPLPGLFGLRIEALLQVHYLCFKSQSLRDSWVKDLQASAAQVARAHTLTITLVTMCHTRY